jgi:hypothetical protein
LGSVRKKTVDHSLHGGPAHPPSNFIWFHLILSTYGSWLPGDPRGFRTWHHQEHVDGNYKIPPPAGKYELRHACNQRKLKQEPVVFSPRWRELIGRALVGRLQLLGGFVLCAAVSEQHAHLLAKLPPGDAREPCGLAKKHAFFEARDRGWTGLMWEVRPSIKRVRTRKYQLNVYHYILEHEGEGAWVWKWEPQP